jgi:Uma2 family endonuclease
MSLVQEAVVDLLFPASDLYSDEPPLETYLHLRQLILFLTCLEEYWRDRNDFFAAGNLTIYFSPNQLKSELFRGPDFFVVLGTERKPRRSWVVWEEEGKYPNVIIEVLSDSTADTDREVKKQLYQETFRTPNYFWFDPVTLEFKGFHLVDDEYQELQANEKGWLWSRELDLYLGIHRSQLRFFTSQGQLVPTPAEKAEQESQRANLESQRANLESQRANLESQRANLESQRAEEESQRAELESQRAERERQRAERLAQRLRELGVDPSEEV